MPDVTQEDYDAAIRVLESLWDSDRRLRARVAELQQRISEQRCRTCRFWGRRWDDRYQAEAAAAGTFPWVFCQRAEAKPLLKNEQWVADGSPCPGPEFGCNQWEERT